MKYNLGVIGKLDTFQSLKLKVQVPQRLQTF
jgi:hypothetical protein